MYIVSEEKGILQRRKLICKIKFIFLKFFFRYYLFIYLPIILIELIYLFGKITLFTAFII